MILYHLYQIHMSFSKLTKPRASLCGIMKYSMQRQQMFKLPSAATCSCMMDHLHGCRREMLAAVRTGCIADTLMKTCSAGHNVGHTFTAPLLHHYGNFYSLILTLSWLAKRTRMDTSSFEAHEDSGCQASDY
jgi:ABC-type phosphonate transport system ATPase subunit